MWLKKLGLILMACSMGGCLGDPAPVDNDVPVADHAAASEGMPDKSGLPFDTKADTFLPPLLDELVPLNSAVRNQGGRNVCTIFSTVALMEHLYIKAGFRAPDFSEQHLQWLIKFKEQLLPHSPLSSPMANLQVIHRRGIVDERAWPYEPSPWAESDDSACTGKDRPPRCHTNGHPPFYVSAVREHYLPAPRPIHTEAIRQHIANTKTGVVVTVAFFFQSWNHRKSNLKTSSSNWSRGIVLAPNAADQEHSNRIGAAHSVLVVGWDDELEVPMVDAAGEAMRNPDGSVRKERGFYIFKNSWGRKSFGVKNPYGAGWGYLSMKYVRDHGSAIVAELPRGPSYRLERQTFEGVVAPDAMNYHSLRLGSEARDVRVAMTGQHDPDLYTRFGTKPTSEDYDCNELATGPEERCFHPEPSASELQLGIFGAASEPSPYTVTVTWLTR